MKNINNQLYRRLQRAESAIGALFDLFFLVQKTAYRDWLDRWRSALGADNRRQNADRTAAPAMSALNNDLK